MMKRFAVVMILAGFACAASAQQYNTIPNLHAKIQECLDPAPGCPTWSDAQVDAWLDEPEQGPWVNVQATDFESWIARWKLSGRLYNVMNEVYEASRASPPGAADAERAAANMLYEIWQRGRGLLSQNSDIRAHLNDAAGAGKVVSTAARDDLLGIARPDVPRYINADWTFSPVLGDVVAARAYTP